MPCGCSRHAAPSARQITPERTVPKREKRKDRDRNQQAGIPWMVPGLFVGMLLGFIAELIFGISMFWMIGGSIAGLVLGALADYIRRRARGHTDEF